VIGKPIDQPPFVSYIDKAAQDLLIKSRDGQEQLYLTTLTINNREEKFRLKMIPLTLEQGGRGIGLIFEQLPQMTDTGADTGQKSPDGRKDGIPDTANLQRSPAEHRKIEKALIESEAKYRALVENISEVIFTLNDHDLITYVSPAIRNLTGYAASDLMGKRLQEFVYAEDAVPFETGLDLARRSGAGPFEFRLITLHKTILWVQVSGTLTDKPGGSGFHGIIADIHERKRIEDALRHATRQIILLNSITRHDILNGLTRLQASLELIRNEPLNDRLLHYIEQQEKTITQIQHQINFTRYYQNIGVRPPKWKDIGERFSAAAATLPAGKVTIVAEVKNIEVFSDDLIERVFSNLIENTLEHGIKAKTIRFFSEKQGRERAGL